MDGYEIDLDSECVWLDDAWLNRDDLAKRIREMLDAGDFQVARPSQALEALTRALSNARLLALRISPELSDALNAQSQASGRAVGSLAREAIASWLAQQGGARPTPAEPAPQQQPPAPAPSEAPAAAPAQAEVGVETEAASAEEAASALELTPKKKEEPATAAVEQRWFGR